MESETEGGESAQRGRTTLTVGEVTAAFSNKADGGPKTEETQTGGLIALIVQLLVPGLFFALLIAVAYVVFMLAIHTKPELEEGLPSIRAFIQWAAPILAGLVLLYYMIKPLTVRKNELEHAIEVSRDEQPVLWAFVAELSRVAKVVTPLRVSVDCLARIRVTPISNADRGSRQDLHLLIGLPLVTSLNARQLGVAILEELTWYQENPGARSARQLHRVVDWIGDIANYRDSCDETIDDTCENGSRWTKPFALATRWLVRVIRSLLRGLQFLAVLLARGVANRQQFSADAVAARLAGPQEFRSMIKCVLMLEGSVVLAARNLRRYAFDRLPEDFPAFASLTEKKLPSDLRHDFQFRAEKEKALITPLQTSTSARIQNSMDLGRGSLLELDRLAADLFEDTLSVTREASKVHYLKIFGEEVLHKAWLVPNDEFVRQEEGNVFGTVLRDEMIDLNEGDKWYKWRTRLSAAGSIIFTIYLVMHAAENMARIGESAEAKYRRHIGNWIIVSNVGTRKVLDVKFLHEGDVVGYRKADTSLTSAFIKSGEKVPIEAPSTGWFYDTGSGHIVSCELQESRAFIYDDPGEDAGEDYNERFRKQVGGDED